MDYVIIVCVLAMLALAVLLRPRPAKMPSVGGDFPVEEGDNIPEEENDISDEDGNISDEETDNPDDKEKEEKEWD